MLLPPVQEPGTNNECPKVEPPSSVLWAHISQALLLSGQVPELIQSALTSGR